VRTTGSSKLGAKFFGLCQVTAKIGSVSYRLQLPPHVKIHNVFHVVFLKKFEGLPPTRLHRCHQLSAAALCPFLRRWFTLARL
jgi:hypothetical protein